MTKERMIRLTFEKEDYPLRYGGPYFIKFTDTEPAPPKDWKPVCWGIFPYCNDPNAPIPHAIVFDTCRNCPFRKS